MKEFGYHLFRSPRPQGIGDLQGISTIIDLEHGDFEKYHNDWYENAVKTGDLAKYGIKHVSIPLSNLTPPSRDQVRRVFQEIDKAALRPGGTLIHCYTGVDRTGFIVAAWRMYRLAWEYDAAVTEMRAAGSHWWFRWWEPFLLFAKP